jgi:hypothetical protein
MIQHRRLFMCSGCDRPQRASDSSVRCASCDARQPTSIAFLDDRPLDSGQNSNRDDPTAPINADRSVPSDSQTIDAAVSSDPD